LISHPLPPGEGRGEGAGWRWPLTALAAWIAAWTSHLALLPTLGPLAPVLASALAAGAALALATSPWRRAIVALGFPLSLLATGAVSAWLWLLPLGVLALVYPVGAWRDAPLFPTPPRALEGLGDALPLPPGARVLDAGCGTGDALAALARAYPAAVLEGVERSAPVALAARLRLRGRATVRRGDLWASDWTGVDLVYAFQRPESMARLAHKAARELAPDALFASLEFPVEGVAPLRTLRNPGEKPLHVYRAGTLAGAPAGPRAVSRRRARRR
jgi:SAM-dependent methyltransferase